MRGQVQDLSRRSSQLAKSIASKDDFIGDQLRRSQEYVARSEKIAQMLTSATSTEQLDKLGKESDQVSESMTDMAWFNRLTIYHSRMPPSSVLRLQKNARVQS